MLISNKALLKKCEERAKGLGHLRSPWEKGNEEVARHTLRWLSPYVSGRPSGGTRVDAKGGKGAASGGVANDRLFNSRAVRAHRICANGMSSGLSSPSQPWFKLDASDPGLRTNHEARLWLDGATEIVRSFLHSTNIYQAMQQGYRELVWSGSESTLFAPHWKYGGVGYNMTWGSYWFGSDDGLRIDTLMRDVPMTVGQVVQMQGGKDKAKKALSKTARKLVDDEKWDATLPIRNLIEPNTDRVFGRIDKTNKPIRSVYWEAGCEAATDDEGILKVDGFERRPFATPRWETQGFEPYAWGPAFDALPDSRKLQLQEIRLQATIDYVARPALSAPVTARNDGANLIPGGITFSSAQDMNAASIRPIWETPPQAIDYIARDLQGRTEPAIDDAFFVPLFTAITNMPGVQPRTVEEIARRHEEQLGQLGPVVDRVQTEKLSVIVMQGFSICLESGLIPPVPESLDGQEIKIDFVSMLAQAQRMIGLSSIERGLGLVGNLSATRPAVLDLVNFDETVREYWERLGVPARTLNSAEDVAASRQSQAQAADQERMAAMMPAVQQGAEAAKLLSETDAGVMSQLAGALMPGV